MLCRLVFDDKGRFSNNDIAKDEEFDYYDYSLEDPPGCSRSITSNFLGSSMPSSAPAKNVTVNKSAYWPNAYYRSIPVKNGTNDGLTLLPYICNPIAARVAQSQGQVAALIPIAAIVVGSFILLLAVLTALFWIIWFLVGCCRRKMV